MNGSYLVGAVAGLSVAGLSAEEERVEHLAEHVGRACRRSARRPTSHATDAERVEQRPQQLRDGGRGSGRGLGLQVVAASSAFGAGVVVSALFGGVPRAGVTGADAGAAGAGSAAGAGAAPGRRAEQVADEAGGDGDGVLELPLRACEKRLCARIDAQASGVVYGENGEKWMILDGY